MKPSLFKLSIPGVSSYEAIETTEPNNLTNVASELMQARTQFHIWHLQSTGVSSYAIHMAIGGFYESLTGFIDSLVETSQGKTKSIIKGYTSEPLMDFESKDQIIKELDELKSDIEGYRVTLDRSWANIDNQLQTIVDVIEQTQYKLLFLN